MSYKSFSEINDYVKQRIPHAELCRGERYSFLKVFQHALSYALNDWTRLLVNHPLRKPLPILLAYYTAKGLRGKSKPAINTDNLIIDQGRVYKKADGSLVSMYFSRIIEDLGKNNTTTINLQPELGLKCDYHKNDLLPLKGLPDGKERKMIREVKALADRTDAANHFTQKEKDFILSSLFIFLESFLFHYRLLKKTRVQRLFLIAHYHNEGIIAACRELNIHSVEIQHGLIAPSDIYYVYDLQFKDAVVNAFFPDNILVYGSYWRGILLEGCEFTKEQIVIAGDYLATAKPAHQGSFPKENIILIGAQKNMEGDYIPYLQSLKAMDLKDWKVIIKLHPLEKEIKQYEALSGGNFSIAGPSTRLDELLEISKIQISIYSTTLYDALGYEMVNYSLQNYGYAAQYAADMVTHGVALPLAIDENPVTRYEKESNALGKLRTREEIYAPYSDKWKQALNIK